MKEYIEEIKAEKLSVKLARNHALLEMFRQCMWEYDHRTIGIIYKRSKISLCDNKYRGGPRAFSHKLFIKFNSYPFDYIIIL